MFSIETQNYRGTDWRHRLPGHGDTDCLRIPVESKANLDLPNKDNVTPAFVAVHKGHTGCLRLLAEGKADLDLPTKDGVTPAFLAAENGHTYCFRLLAESKANLETADNTGVTPLGIVVSRDRVDAVQLLVTHGVAVNPPPDNWGDTPLSEAKAAGHSAMVEILLAAGAK